MSLGYFVLLGIHARYAIYDLARNIVHILGRYGTYLLACCIVYLLGRYGLYLLVRYALYLPRYVVYQLDINASYLLKQE